MTKKEWQIKWGLDSYEMEALEYLLSTVKGKITLIDELSKMPTRNRKKK